MVLWGQTLCKKDRESTERDKIQSPLKEVLCFVEGFSLINKQFTMPPLTSLNKVKLTHIFGFLMILLNVTMQFGFPLPHQIYFNPFLLPREPWRVLASILWMGPLNFENVFQSVFMLRYMIDLETNNFHKRKSDFAYMIFINTILIALLSATFVNALFLSSPFNLMLVYLWSRKNPLAMMNFMGIFAVPAPWIPWLLLSVGYLVNGKVPGGELVGIVVGHFYYYMMDVYPMLLAGGRRSLICESKRLFSAPRFFVYLFDEVEVVETDDGGGDDIGNGTGLGTTGTNNNIDNNNNNNNNNTISNTTSSTNRSSVLANEEIEANQELEE